MKFFTPKTRTVLLASLAFSTVALEGCGKSNDEPSAEDFDERYPADPQSQARLAADLYQAIDEKTAECMEEKGFELPSGNENSSEYESFLELSQSESDESYVAKYGFGKTAAAVAQFSDTPTDPWLAYRSSLEPTAREAFDRALGVQLGENQRQSGLAPGSCMDLAQREAGGGIIQEGADLEKVQLAIEADSGYQPLMNEYHECMKAAGYPDAMNLDWAPSQVDRQLLEALNGATIVLADGTEISASIYYGQQQISEVRFPPSLETAKKFELDVADADFKCRQPISDRMDALTEPYKVEYMRTRAESQQGENE